MIVNPVGWGVLENTPTESLQRGKTSPYKCSGYDIKPSGDRALA